MLGMAEAGLLPGVMVYVSHWFPQRYRARYNAMFNLAIPVSYVVAAWISGAIFSLDGVAKIKGWQWLFLLEGLPAVVLGIFGLFYLSNRPAEARWLDADERQLLERALERDAKADLGNCQRSSQRRWAPFPKRTAQGAFLSKQGEHISPMGVISDDLRSALS